MNNLRSACALLFLVIITTGLVYPLLMTGIGQILFNHQANGSLIYVDGKLKGSELIGQPFKDPKYFWSRPSATTPYPYNATASNGSNFGPLNPEFLSGIKGRVKSVQEGNKGSIPIDLVTSSASGIDPHISIASAQYQIPRVAHARNLSEDKVNSLLDQHIDGPTWGFLGEPRVNVLLLNLALDNMSKRH